MRSLFPTQSMRADHSFPLNKLPLGDVCEPKFSTLSSRNGILRSVTLPATTPGGNPPKYVAQFGIGGSGLAGVLSGSGCVPVRYVWSAGVIPNSVVNWPVANPVNPVGKLAGHI